MVKAITTAVQRDDLSNIIPGEAQVISKSALTMSSQKKTHNQWQKEQQDDEVILEVLRALKNKLKSS